MANYERINEKTPSGGDYSEIYYFDNNDNPVDEKEATKFVIRECDFDGNLIQEIFGLIEQ